MKLLISLILISIFLPATGQDLEEKRRLLDPRNYANGLVFVDDTELQVKGADLSSYEILDTSRYVVVYRFRHPYLPKTRPEVADGEMMKLEIGDRTTAFYSKDLYETDSIYTILIGRGTPRDMNTNSVRFMVYYDRAKSSFEVVNRMPLNSGEAVSVADLSKPVWDIDTLRREINGYACFRATTTYNGRKWVVWFAPEIPLSCGPWKLIGLPGLVLAAEDADGLYSFLCVELSEERIPIKRYRWRCKSMNKASWLKLERRMYIDPYSLFGASTLIISGKKRGRLDETWEIPYYPIEVE